MEISKRLKTDGGYSEVPSEGNFQTQPEFIPKDIDKEELISEYKQLIYLKSNMIKLEGLSNLEQDATVLEEYS